MNTHFNINFRREAYVQEVSRRRRRIVALGVWVAYFGVLSMLIGLYALNGASLARRARLLERQTNYIRNAKESGVGLQLSASDLTQVETYARSTRQWRDRLERVGNLLPPEARLSALSVNPQNMSDAASRDELVFTGELHNAPGQDRMQGVMKIVAELRADSVLKRSYSNIKLASTRISEDGSAEFEIQCR